MSISLTGDNTFKGITLHSFNDNLEDSNPSEHSANDDIVALYVLMKDVDNEFGIQVPILRDTMVNFKEQGNVYSYFQSQWIENPERFQGWIYADELDINKLLRKEEK